MLLNNAVYNGTENSLNGRNTTIGEFKTKATYEDLHWNFGDNATHPWKIDPDKNNGLPYLYYQEL
jgi:hypothetical protein